MKSKIKQRATQLQNTWTGKIRKNLTQDFSKETELNSLQEEFANLSPMGKNTLDTLIENSSFKRKVQLPKRDELCAYIAEYSYLPPEKRPYQIGEFYLEPKYNSIFHCVYLNHQKKICIIWYKGTDIKLMSDLISDAQIILGINAIDPRVVGNIKLFDQIRKDYPLYKKWICGHSLGGTFCYIIAKHREVDYCCTFNPGSAPNRIFFIMLKDTLLKEERTKRVSTYKILGDPVSLFSYVGKTVNFFIFKWNPINLHMMDNFLPKGDKK